MKKLRRSEILDLVEYEKARDQFLAKTIELKKLRRVGVGNLLTFIFENRDTVRFQVQEMLRAERAVDEDAIAHEIQVYNQLIPGKAELSATLMIEITESEQIRPTLDRLAGIDEFVCLDLGEIQVRASFDPRQFEEDRISAVQYLRFRLGDEGCAAFLAPANRVQLRVSHPEYDAEIELEGDVRASLAADLRDD